MKKYLFIDAASLIGRVRSLATLYCDDPDALKLNWHQVAGGFAKVFYYDALPGQRKSEPEEDFLARRAEAEARHFYLQTLDKFRVYEGDARWRKGRGHEQKKVDVMITVDMMKHTIRRNMDEAALVASDVDFRPLLDALVDEGMFVTLFYNPTNTSAELLGAADARRPLTLNQIWQWLDRSSQECLGIHPFVSLAQEPGGDAVGSFPHSKLGQITAAVRDNLPTLEWREAGGLWQQIRWQTVVNLVKLAADDYGIQVPAEIIGKLGSSQ